MGCLCAQEAHLIFPLHSISKISWIVRRRPALGPMTCANEIERMRMSELEEGRTAPAQPAPAASDATPEVTVIVPVCNVERYLAECLDTLAAQTLQSMEILLVNDGSTDGSPQILEEYAARDPRMRVINKPNGGYGSGVNMGLSQARGRYVGIVEPDDFIDKHMYEELLQAAKLKDGGWADVVKSSYWEYYDIPGEEPYIEAPNLMNCMPIRPFQAKVKDEFEVLFHHPSIWSCLYRREFLEAKQIRLMEVPGGGWVDNPFFYETLLQAETFVWTPCAYYYYRQTNPTSSSNLKDYHLPFDRLRDLRALFARMNVTDPQLIACLYSRHFYYMGSVLGTWGFSEQDPELKELIHEAMAALDPDIVYGDYKGMKKDYRDFYESIMKDPARDIAAHEKIGAPRVSIVVPACNDRDILPATLADLANQMLDALEVICVDCGSQDMTPEIGESFAKKDARFSFVHVDEQGYAAGMRAGLAQASAPLCAVVLPGQAVPKQYFSEVVEAAEDGIDLYVFTKAGTRCHSPIREKEGSGVFASKGRNAELLLCAAEGISGCTFRTDFLREAGIEVREGDDDGLILMLEAVHASGKVMLRQEQGLVPRARTVTRSFAKGSDKDDLELFRDHMKVLDEAYELAGGMDEDALRAARCLAVRRMLDDERIFVSADHGEEIFDELAAAFRDKYGFADAPVNSYCNQNAYQALKRALATPSYTDTLRRENAHMHSANTTLRKRCESIKGSGSYRVGNALVRAGSKVLPPSLRRKLKS